MDFRKCREPGFLMLLGLEYNPRPCQASIERYAFYQCNPFSVPRLSHVDLFVMFRNDDSDFSNESHHNTLFIHVIPVTWLDIVLLHRRLIQLKPVTKNVPVLSFHTLFIQTSHKLRL